MALRLMLALLTVVLATGAPGGPAGASPQTEIQQPAEFDALLDAMATRDLLRIVRQEGVAQAAVLEADMFPGRGGERWTDMVSGIYDIDRIGDVLRTEIASVLSPEHIAPALAFFRSGTGGRVVGLELSAREAMLEPSVEDAARENFLAAAAGTSERLAQIRDLSELLDLVDRNVSGGLNANLAFYEGLNAGGGFGSVRPEAEVLSDVWQQEPEVRQESEIWVLSYLLMAYQPLSDAELAEYMAFSGTPAGQAVNAAVFAGFDQLFRGVSRALGLASARFMVGEDL
jgi:hypothetical protein